MGGRFLFNVLFLQSGKSCDSESGIYDKQVLFEPP